MVSQPCTSPILQNQRPSASLVDQLYSQAVTGGIDPIAPRADGSAGLWSEVIEKGRGYD